MTCPHMPAIVQWARDEDGRIIGDGGPATDCNLDGYMQPERYQRCADCPRLTQAGPADGPSE